MQNIPRIYVNEILETGKSVAIDKSVAHYLRRVMRRNDCLVFNSGFEYNAVLGDDDKNLVIGKKTEHVDPSNNVALYFAPIKRMDDLLNMATQMGVGELHPVITQRTVANHINWERMKKIIIEACEQSGRNSVPALFPAVKFDDLDLTDFIVADERFAHLDKTEEKNISGYKVLVGPEGGFSEKEFEKMDNCSVKGLSLGKTIVAVSKVLDK